MYAASGPVAPAGMTGVAIGLGGGTTRVVERVAWTVGERARHRCVRVLQLRLVLTGAAFEFRSSCIAWSVAYVGLLSIGGMLGFLKLSMSLLTEGAAMVGVKK